jgi:orotate phosphoribosyltransferase
MKDDQREKVEGKENLESASTTPKEGDLARKRERLLGIIRRESLLQNKDFRLVSGRSSNFFFDMKKTMLDPEGASLLADLLFEMIRVEDVDYMQVVNQARQFECTILKVISVVDRLEGAEENFRAAGIEFDALFTWRDFS